MTILVYNIDFSSIFFENKPTSMFLLSLFTRHLCTCTQLFAFFFEWHDGRFWNNRFFSIICFTRSYNMRFIDVKSTFVLQLVHFYRFFSRKTSKNGFFLKLMETHGDTMETPPLRHHGDTIDPNLQRATPLDFFFGNNCCLKKSIF